MAFISLGASRIMVKVLLFAKQILTSIIVTVWAGARHMTILFLWHNLCLSVEQVKPSVVVGKIL